MEEKKVKFRVIKGNKKKGQVVPNSKGSSSATSNKVRKKQPNKKTVQKQLPNSKPEVKQNQGQIKTKNQTPSKARSKTKKVNRIKIWIIVSLMIVFCLITVGIYFLTRHSYFNISAITIKGNQIVQTEKITENLNISVGSNVFLSYLKFDEQVIEANPYIKKISKSIKFPNKIEITIVERKPKYFIYDKEKSTYYYVDAEFIIVDSTTDIAQKGESLLISGIVFDDQVELGSSINEIDTTKIRTYEKIKKEYEKHITEMPITYVNFENENIRLYLNDKVQIILKGEENLEYNLKFLKDILETLGDTTGIIDMTKEKPTYMKF